MMKIHSIIPIAERQNHTCHFCGEARSVKYMTEIKYPTPTLVACCNKCIMTADADKACKYQTIIPAVGCCCGAYYASKRKDGQIWTHFPFCDDLYCPIKHPEFLEGATL